MASMKSEYVRLSLFVAKIYPHCTAKDRIAGATTEINALKDAYNRGEYPIRERD